ncbi:MAG: DUF2857 domain-containing protein [Zoogloeaceae bacterium]|jgi:signal transduction histidine kinase|nr:DUF2857 domain-containing protein [Zoogloeaceae bacterium]
MPEPNPLNQAVITQVLYDLRNGKFQRVKSMGFDEATLKVLKHPATVSMLVNTTVPWCSVTINLDTLRSLLQRDSEIDREFDEIDRLLRLGATTEILGEFYGLTHQEVALRRITIDQPRRKGRHRVLSDEESSELWRRCSTTVRQERIDPQDKKAILRMAADMAEEMRLPLAVIWNALCDWIKAKQF